MFKASLRLFAFFLLIAAAGTVAAQKKYDP